jgi:beta-xylosidase
MHRTKILFSIICLLKCTLLNAQTIAGDLADPSIIRVDSVYYATGTSSEWAPYFPIYKSSDLKNWHQTGYVFDKAPEWTTGSFWAPEYYKIGDTYYIYYTARRKSDNRSYIGVATSPYPDRGFTDHGIIIEHGKEAIDAFIFNDGGQLYITFKAYGLDDRPIELLGARLSADGLKTEGEFFTLLKDTSRAGMEGQSILKINNYYYLFYSGGNCCGQGCSYFVSVARSANFKGPYQSFAGNPILSENDVWKCMGHGTFVTAEDGIMYYLHHAYNKKSNVFTGREALMSQMIYQEYTGWPVFKLLPNNTAAQTAENSLDRYWQWDFRHASPSYKLQKGHLRLSGKQTKDNLSGIALTVRPTSDNFDITTAVVNHNKALKGLTIYGDANAAIGIGVEGDSVKVWKVEKNERVIINAAKVPRSPIQLKISMSPGKTCDFFYQTNEWIKLASNISIAFLPQWDRSPRLGLHYRGNEKDNAEFSFFRLDNK